MTASQRARIFSAMATVTAVKGYAATTVADLIAVAGVSRETFYEQFSSKLDCFEQAFEDSTTLLLATMEESYALPAGIGVSASRLECFERALRAYLDSLAKYPELARLCLVEVYAAGPQMIRRRIEVQERLAARLEALFDVHDSETRFASRAVVAAISNMVTVRLAVGETKDLPALHAPLCALVRRLMQ